MSTGKSIIFRDIPENIVELAVNKFPWNKTEDTHRFTGVPHHVAQLTKFEELELTIASIPETFMKMTSDKRWTTGDFLQLNTRLVKLQMLLPPCLKNAKDLLEKTGICKRATVTATTESTPLNVNTGLVMKNEDDDDDRCNQ